MCSRERVGTKVVYPARSVYRADETLRTNGLDRYPRQSPIVNHGFRATLFLWGETTVIRVLVVDDEKQYCENLSLCLTGEGYEVATACTSDEAIDLGKDFCPDVLVADWMLRSDDDGLDVSRCLRSQLPKLETVLITGYPSIELHADARRSNVFEVLEKPFELDDLLSVVQYAARSSDAGGPNRDRP